MADNGHKRKDKVKEKQKMGIFDRFKVLTVNDAINESRTDKNAVLIDIRAKDVYKRGYISGICKRRLTNNLATCKVNCECPLYEKRYGTEMVNDGKERNQKTIQDTAK